MTKFDRVILSCLLTIGGMMLPELHAGMKTYVEFQVGITGIYAKIDDSKLVVTKTIPDTPAHNKFNAGDVLVSVNGTSLATEDLRHELGNAINQAEGKDGIMTFEIEREGKKINVTIKLNPIGSYSETWPLGCKKSRYIIEQAAKHVLQKGPGGAIEGNLDGLFLLSTGIPKYIEAAKKWAVHNSPGTCGDHSWYNGYQGVFLGEYYLATGDKSVLPTIKALCDDATKRQYYGGWNHWGDQAGIGYVCGGLMNPAGTQILTSLILARECGVKFDERTYDKALAFFYRFAGHGNNPYGDHRPERGFGSNGKNGMLACALTLLPDAKFQGAAQVLGLTEAFGYSSLEYGHAAHFGDITWRGIASSLAPKHKQKTYRAHMDQLMWYYDLSRMPDGGFSLLPRPTSMGGGGGGVSRSDGLIGLTYTAPLKTLRITGKPRTKYSVTHRPTAIEKSLEHTDFHKTDFAEGGSDVGLLPHELIGKFEGPDKKQMSAEWYATQMRHYLPQVRFLAANALGFMDSSAGLPEIIKALKSPDARVREAGFQAISGYNNWGAPAPCKTSRSDVTDKCLTYILKPLKDPDAAMWEKHGALYALARAEPKTLAANLPLIKRYMKDEEWFLRLAAWQCITPLVPDLELIRPLVPMLVKEAFEERHVYAFRGIKLVVQEVIAHDSLRLEYIAAVNAAVKGWDTPPYPRNLDKDPVDARVDIAIAKGLAIEVLRYMLKLNERPENALLVSEMFFQATRAGHGGYMINGGWGYPGLPPLVSKLGKDAGPLVSVMKTIVSVMKQEVVDKKDDKGFVDGQNKTISAAIECIKKWEDEYGEVKPASMPKPTVSLG